MASTVDEADPLAKERDVKFKKWLQNKAIKEKAFEVRHCVSCTLLLLSYACYLVWLVFVEARPCQSLVRRQTDRCRCSDVCD